MATIGFAVGLGNIWRFPYVAGESGGGAFVLLYLLFAFSIGVPIVIAEILIGRRGRSGAVGSLKALVGEEKVSSLWVGVGYLNQIAALLIQVTYAVIAGWVLLYFFRALATGFVGIDPESAGKEFQAVTNDLIGMLFWTTLSIALCGYVLYSGLKRGIERAVGLMMPTLFIVLVILIGFNFFAGGFYEALDWLFRPDFSMISMEICLAALGQAFFSIGVAMAVMMTYGSYLPKDTNVVSSAVTIVFADTLVAVLAGLVIFPVVFSNHLDPAAGPGLIFQVLPVAFSLMPGGHFFGVLFFLLLSVAAITSMIGLLESLVFWIENSFGYSRPKSTLLVVGANIFLSAISVFAYAGFGDWWTLDISFNDLLDYVSNQILLPLGGLLIAVFSGWFISRNSSQSELNQEYESVYIAWRFFVRWPVPLAVSIILLTGVMV